MSDNTYIITSFAFSKIKPKALNMHPFQAFQMFRKKLLNDTATLDLQHIERRRSSSQNYSPVQTYRKQKNYSTLQNREIKKEAGFLFDLPKIDKQSVNKPHTVSPNFPFNLNYLIEEIKKKKSRKKRINVSPRQIQNETLIQGVRPARLINNSLKIDSIYN